MREPMIPSPRNPSALMGGTVRGRRQAGRATARRRRARGGARPRRPRCGCARRAWRGSARRGRCAVFSAMKSSAPISRFVAPRGDQREDLALAGREPERVVRRRRRAGPPAASSAPASRRRRARAARPSISPLASRRRVARPSRARRRAARAAASRSPAATCASASRQRAGAAGYGRSTRVPRVRGARPSAAGRPRRARASPRPRRVARATPPRRAAASAAGLDAGEEQLGRRSARARAPRRRRGRAPAAAASASTTAPGRGDPGEARDVLGAELDAVERRVDRRARRVEVAVAALQLGPQRADDADELRLVDVGDELASISSRSARPRRASPRPRASSARRRARLTR